MVPVFGSDFQTLKDLIAEISQGNVALSDFKGLLASPQIRDFPGKSCTFRLLKDMLGAPKSEILLGNVAISDI